MTQMRCSEATHVRHKKRGSAYVVMGLANLQSSRHPETDGVSVVIYRGQSRTFARPVSEFDDGRLEIVHPQPAAGTNGGSPDAEEQSS